MEFRITRKYHAPAKMIEHHDDDDDDDDDDHDDHDHEPVDPMDSNGVP
jgi:hypothetical protein